MVLFIYRYLWTHAWWDSDVMWNTRTIDCTYSRTIIAETDILFRYARTVVRCVLACVQLSISWFTCIYALAKISFPRHICINIQNIDIFFWSDERLVRLGRAKTKQKKIKRGSKINKIILDEIEWEREQIGWASEQMVKISSPSSLRALFIGMRRRSFISIPSVG